MELVQLIRESISSVLFLIAMGQSYYYESRLVSLFISIILYLIVLYFVNKIELTLPRATLYLALLTGLIVAFASIRYMPFGGDAQIYCDYIKMDLNGRDVYLSTEKYAFNYPPFFLGVIGQFCKYNYDLIYPVFYSLLIIAVGFFYSREYVIKLSTTMILLSTSFLGLRWIFKTGNFLIWEIIFLSLAIYFSNKNQNITLALLVLFGFQRLWFLLAAVFWYIIAKEKINYRGLYGSLATLLVLILVRVELLKSYLVQLYEGDTLSSVWNGNANHNSPSLFLNVVDLFNLENSFTVFFLLYCIAVFSYIYRNLNSNLFSDKSHLLSQTIFLLIVLNPTFKPYLALLATISLFPLFALMKQSSLDHFIFIYCFLINFFWIIGSVFPMGYPYSVFQIVFFISSIKVINNTNYYILDD